MRPVATHWASPDEVTAAATDVKAGSLRHDPFAMLPFCGYNMADYWGHWLKIGEHADPEKLPKIYQVNWFRKDSDGKFIWPGFGENSRVLAWIVERVEGKGNAVDTAIGGAPAEGELFVDGLGLSEQQLTELFEVDPDSWLAECDLTEEYFTKFGDKVPAKLWDELNGLRERLQAAKG